MNERALFESLLEGPRLARDLPGNDRARRKMARVLETGPEPLLTRVFGTWALTPAGFDYAERVYGLIPQIGDEEDRKLKKTIESLGKAGDALQHGGDWMKFFRYQIRCIGIGLGLSATLYAVMVSIGQWPR